MVQSIFVRGINNLALDAREDRLINEILTEGLLVSGNEFKVVQQASPNMTVRVGSGAVGDRYVVEGIAGAGVYIVRDQDAYVGSGNSDVAIANGDATFDRIDGIDLIVYDDPFDSSGESKSEVVVTQGTPAAGPVAPALPAALAVARLATILVAANESTSIVTGDITDTRAASSAWTQGRGYVTTATVTANQGSITTVADVTGLTVTFTAVAGRRYKLTAGGQLSSSVNADTGSILISTAANATVKIGATGFLSSVAGVDVFALVVVAPGAGSITYKVRCLRNTGTGNVTFGALSTNPGFLLVEDIGGFLP